MKNPRAFIALITSVLISAVLLAAAVSGGSAALVARTGALRGEYKKIADSLAESCATAALLKLAQNYAYQPSPSGDPVAVGGHGCRIVSVSTQSSSASGKNVAILSFASYQSAFTLLHTEALIPNPFVSSLPIRLGASKELSTP